MDSAPGSLDGKVAIVTGASRGIGRAIAERFLAAGAEVVVGSRSRPEPALAAAWIPTDVADPAQVEALVRRTVETHGRLDLLVNNAGVEHTGTVEATTLDDWERVLAVNLTAPFLATKHTFPYLREADGGAIVNVSSTAGLTADAANAAYCASKAGLVNLTRATAIDGGPAGIRCNCICPGYVRTAMLDEWFDALPDPERERREAAGKHPLGRLGEPADVAAAVLWLASDEAAFVTGQVFIVDGGLTAVTR